VSLEVSSSEAEVHQKRVHQKLKITRSYSSSGDANLKLQKLFNGFNVVQALQKSGKEKQRLIQKDSNALDACSLVER